MTASPSPSPPSAPLTGLVAAVFTPFHRSGEVAFDEIPRLTDHLVRNGGTGLYICGSTGEGASLTMEERKAVAKIYVEAAKGRLRTIVHVGHTCVRDVAELIRHASEIGADAVSAVAPFYFKPDSVASLIAFFREACVEAPDLPFYYYHIPALTGPMVDPAVFLREASEELPNLRGIKFTDADLSSFMACREVGGGRFDVVFGRDEMLLSAWAAGARGAVGSTYNLAPGLYRRILEAYEAGKLEAARRWQEAAVRMIRALVSSGGEAAIKYAMHRLGFDCGARRLPGRQLTREERGKIDRSLTELRFEEWATRNEPEGGE